jgi:hypothetical protein
LWTPENGNHQHLAGIERPFDKPPFLGRFPRDTPPGRNRSATMPDSLNLVLQYTIRKHDLSEIIPRLRSGDVSGIDAETWNLIADLIEGKIKRPKNRPQDSKIHIRNYLSWERHRELMDQRNTYDEALDIMAGEEAANTGNGDAISLRGRIKGYVDAGAKLRPE